MLWTSHARREEACLAVARIWRSTRLDLWGLSSNSGLVRKERLHTIRRTFRSNFQAKTRRSTLHLRSRKTLSLDWNLQLVQTAMA